MADTSIYIKNQLNKNSLNENTRGVSTSGTRAKINQTKQSSSILGIAKKSETQVENALSSVNGGGGTLGMLKSTLKAGITLGVITTTLNLASKGVDLYLGVASASSGQSVYYGNLKATKSLITSFGGNYVYGWLNNEIITKKIVKRQNTELEYGQQLFNLINYSEKNKIR